MAAKKTRRSAQVKLSYHRQSGQYKKCIGKYISTSGKVLPRIWYLGTDSEDAEIQALELLRQWKKLKREGKEIWDNASLHREDAGDSAIKPISVQEAIELYLNWLGRRFNAKQVTKSHLDSQKYRLAKALKPIRLLALSSVGENQISKAVLALAERPKSDNRVADPKPISRIYAQECIKALRAFFEWADGNEYWGKPKAFARCFADGPKRNDEDRQNQLEESLDGEPRRFSIEDLTILYAAADDRQKLWICLGLNCGFSSAEIATLQWGEVHELDGNEPFIARHRRKTDIYAKWWLFPETAALLQRLKAGLGPAPVGNVFHSECGELLTNSNAIGQSWKRLLLRVELDVPLTFKYLRKTGAWLMRCAAGTDVAEMYLAHADRGMIRHYSGRDWVKLADALKCLRDELTCVLGAATRPGRALQEESQVSFAFSNLGRPEFVWWPMVASLGNVQQSRIIAANPYALGMPNTIML